MAYKLLLDANVCIDFLIKRNRYEQCNAVFVKIRAGELTGFVTPAIVHIIAFYLAKVYSKPLVKETIIHLLTTVKIIDCNHDTALKAIHSKMTDIEDALQYYTAIHHKLDYFITLDKNLIKASTTLLPICSPQTLLNELSE